MSDLGYLLPNLNIENRGLQGRYQGGQANNAIATSGGDGFGYEQMEPIDELQTSNAEAFDQYLGMVDKVNDYALKGAEFGVDVTNPDPRNPDALAFAREWQKMYNDALIAGRRLKQGREIEKSAYQLSKSGMYGSLPNDGRVYTHQDLENFANLKGLEQLQKTYGKRQKFTDKESMDAYNLNVDDALNTVDESIEIFRSTGNTKALEAAKQLRNAILRGELNQLEIDKFQRQLQSDENQMQRHKDNMNYKYSKLQQDKDKDDKKENNTLVKPQVLRVQNGETELLLNKKYGSTLISNAVFDDSGLESNILLYDKDGEQITEPISTSDFNTIASILAGDKSMENVLNEPEPDALVRKVDNDKAVSDLVSKAFDNKSDRVEAEQEIRDNLKDGYDVKIKGSWYGGARTIIITDENGNEVARRQTSKNDDFEQSKSFLKKYLKDDITKREIAVPRLPINTSKYNP